MIQKAEQIRSIFRNHSQECAPVVENALRISEYLRRISPFIDRHAGRVCLGCSTKCCINQHAYYTLDDLIYISALGLTPEAKELHRSSYRKHCQFLAGSGCVLERNQRPLGCTWHFCDDLTVNMQKDDRDAYRGFSKMFDELFLTWLELSSKFRILYREKSGEELDENILREVTHVLSFPRTDKKSIPSSLEA